MIFEQLFDKKSSTYTYIISSGKGREALIIDPVIESTDKYIKVLKNLDLKLVKVIDTHIHADHISGLNELSKRTRCSKIMGEQSSSEVLDIRVKDNEKIKIENIELISMYTPGHTDCSYSFLMNDRVFTGDILLINGTGRTDFQNGSSHDAYHSLFNKLLKLPEKTLIYPAHDYNGKKYSTIENEKNNNPRLQVSSAEEYAEIMDNLNLENPEMMDIAVPANIKGFTLNQIKLSDKIVIVILVRVFIFTLCLAIIQNVIVKTAIVKVVVAMEAKTVCVHLLALIAVVITSN